MKKKIILFLFFGFWFFSYGQEVNYLGNNKLHNFSIKITNQSDSIFLYTLKQGQIIHSENLDFAVASNRNFWIEAKSIKLEVFTAYALENTAFPDSGTTATLRDVIHDISLPELQKLETESFWGNKAQIKLWNTLDGSTLDVQKKYIYSFSQKVVIESIKESVVFAQACLNNTPIDTLIKNKYVGIGQYNLSYNKNILSSAQGNPSVRIVDTDGKILYSSISLPLTTDSIFIENNMVYVAKKTHQKASLHVFDKNNKLICVPLENIGLAKGKNKKTYAFTYLGKPTDTLIIKLFDAKRKLLKEEKIFSAKLNEQKKNPKTTEKYFQIKEMYVSKRDELRTTCLVENTKGETLATIFDGRNIHSGINKVNYQLKHTLEEGETIFLIIKLNSGKIISKTALLIK